MASGGVLGIRLGFHHHPPEQLAIGLAFHQQAADEVGGDLLGGAAEEGLGEGLGKRGGYGSGFWAIRLCKQRSDADDDNTQRQKDLEASFRYSLGNRHVLFLPDNSSSVANQYLLFSQRRGRANLCEVRGQIRQWKHSFNKRLFRRLHF